MITAGIIGVTLVAIGAPATTLATSAPELPVAAPASPIADEDWAYGAALSLYSGMGVLTRRSEWNRQLVSTGYEPLDPFTGELGARLALSYNGAVLGVSGAYGMTVSDGEGRRELSLGSLFVEGGYDLARTSWLTIQPSAGLGWVRSSFCFMAQPGDAVPPPVGPPIAQILRAPGRRTCLDTDTAAARVGFLLGVRATEDGAALLAGIRPTFSVPFAQSAYRVRDEGLPPIAGPDAPPVTFMVNVELGLGVGFGRRVW
ncbi:MAG: hypothetical protein JNL21_24755 [Myxococcales bacterium]|nr:hypothetical protein [Myxococcales bacterium]